MKIEDYAQIVKQMASDDKDRDELYLKIDKAVRCKFEPSSEVTKLPWVQDRHYGLTNIADARNVGARTFSTLLPTIEISPTRDTEREYQRTEMAEQILAWEFERMNRVQSTKGFHDKVVESAITYHSVALQVEYLPYKLKGVKKDSRIKALLSRKKYNWIVHHPGTVHSHTSDMGLERVAKVVVMTGQQLLDNFPEKSKGRSRLLEDNDKTQDLMKAKYTLVDYMDWNRRIKWAYEGEGEVCASDIVFMDEEHGLPFIPWVIINYGDPLWESVINSGIWENVQYVNLIMFAKALEQSTRSTLVFKTPDGTLQNVYIDYTNPSNPIVVPLDGTQVEDQRPAPLDPQLSEQFQGMMNQISSSTVSQVLTDIGQYSNAPFSTVEKIIQLALGQLSPAKKTAEAAEAEGIYQMFQWIEHSEIPLVGYRQNVADAKQGEGPKLRGEQVAIWNGKEPSQEEVDVMTPEERSLWERTVYFDLEHLYIKVLLQADNVADEQTRLNLYINATREMGMSKKDAWEKLGWKNYKLSEAHRAEETLFEAELQTEAQMIQLKVQEAQMQMQAQMQEAQMMQQQQMKQEQMMQEQQMSQNEMNAGSQFAGAQGVDPRAGGQPPSRNAPFETREAITGQTQQGGQVV